LTHIQATNLVLHVKGYHLDTMAFVSPYKLLHVMYATISTCTSCVLCSWIMHFGVGPHKSKLRETNKTMKQLGLLGMRNLTYPNMLRKMGLLNTQLEEGYIV
jgi:hypothetical protein